MGATIEQVKYSLDQRGYGLILMEEIPPQENLPLNLLIGAILKDYPERRIVNGLPVILHNAMENEIIDAAGLLSACGLANPVGYAYETSAYCLGRSGKSRNTGLLRECSGSIVPEEKEFIIPQDAGEMMIAHIRENERTRAAVRWNVVDHNREADFIESIKNYLKG